MSENPYPPITKAMVFKIDDVTPAEMGAKGTVTQLVGGNHFCSARNISVQIQKWNKGGGVPYHHHEQREMVVICQSGKGKELIDGVEYDLEPGVVVFAPPGCKHRSVCTEPPLVLLEVFSPYTDKTYRLDEKTGKKSNNRQAELAN